MRSTAIPSPARPIRRARQSCSPPAKYDAAIDDFNAALNVDSNNADAWAGLGYCYEKLNNRAKAVESYQRALQVNPNLDIARTALIRLS